MDNCTSKELVKRAVHMEGPWRIPVLRNREENFATTDILSIPIGLHYTGPDHEYSEWGFHWIGRNPNLSFGASTPNLTSWDKWDSIVWPRPDDGGRFVRYAEVVEKWGVDRYLIGDLGLTGFTIMCLMRGTAELFVDLYEEPQWVSRLGDKIFDVEEEIIALMPKYGFDAIGLADDYGTQHGLMISPAMWRQVVKPRLAHQTEYAHSLGLDVYLHSCGRVIDIIPDLIEIGVDAINLGQVSLNGVEELGKRFAGKICFSCPVSYQTTGVNGTAEGIAREMESFKRHLNTDRGGLIVIANKNPELKLRDDVIEQAVLRVTSFRNQ